VKRGGLVSKSKHQKGGIISFGGRVGVPNLGGLGLLCRGGPLKEKGFRDGSEGGELSMDLATGWGKNCAQTSSKRPHIKTKEKKKDNEKTTHSQETMRGQDPNIDAGQPVWGERNTKKGN